MRKVLFVIEHLEKLSPWVFFEYENSSKIVGGNNLLITNVKDESEEKELRKIANVSSRSVKDLVKTEFKNYRVIVLDLKAEEQLKPEDFTDKTIVVIGGILGDHPPRERTYKYITKHMIPLKNVIIRNLGKEQLTIDGSAYVAYRISQGVKLENLEYVYGLKITRKIGSISHEIYLPYKYPVVNGKPLVNEKLLKYLQKGIVVDEIMRFES